ncbi:MAG: GldG family protein [Spirochaetes bacterium]|nr:GldG family protein [Spirochaetota bacterium]
MENIKAFLASRRASTILYVALFFAFSWLSYGAYVRFDLSSTGAMRISSTTKKLLRNLPERATIELFVSNDLPDEAVLVSRKARDFVTEYVSASRGRVKLTILDPDNDKSAAERAKSLGVQQLDIAVRGSKKAQAQAIYFGLGISYGSKSEPLNNLISLYEQHDLENQLTAKIFKMVKPNEKKIAILASHGNFSLKKEQNPNSLSVFADKISAFYGDILEINTTTQDIPVEVSTLIIVQPGKLEPIDKFRIDQFVMRGGNLIVAASGMEINFSQQFMAAPGNPDLVEFLKRYGIDLATDMVNEPKPNYFIPFVQPINNFQMEKLPYPPWVIVPRDNLSQNNLASKGNAAFIMPYTSSVKINPTILPTGDGAGKFKIDILAKSTADAWAQANFAFLDPAKMGEMLAAPKQNTGTHNLALMIQGKFPSQFATGELPKEAPKTFLKAAEKDSRILVVGTPYALSNMMLILTQMTGAPLLEENLKLFFSAIDIMHGNEDLVELRKKSSPRIKAKLVEEGTRKFFTLLAFVAPLLGIGVFGSYRLMKRKNQTLVNENTNSAKPTEA